MNRIGISNRLCAILVDYNILAENLLDPSHVSLCFLCSPLLWA